MCVCVCVCVVMCARAMSMSLYYDVSLKYNSRKVQLKFRSLF